MTAASDTGRPASWRRCMRMRMGSAPAG